MMVDHFGADPATVTEQGIKIAFVTAAKQQPLTVSMPVKRKQELLNWAAENNAFIIEDDLGSEFRYEGRPIPPLKAIDHNNQVIYIGAFSMSLLQTLRLGFMIMPKELARHCRQLIRVRYRAMPQITEQILARFIQDGHYSRHLHKTRRIYASRQKILLNILQEEFNDIFEPVNLAAGFYNLCYYRDQDIDEKHILVRCEQEGLGIAHLGYYYPDKKPPKKGLLLGFASSTEAEIIEGMKILGKILRSKS
jgi:GntR family transcriptional regulator/MocR family aminotransferase